MQVIENQNRIVCNQAFNEDEYFMLPKHQNVRKITKITNHKNHKINYEL